MSSVLNEERQDDELWADNFQEGRKFVLADLFKTQRTIVRVTFWGCIGSAWKGERLAKNRRIFEMMPWNLEQCVLDLFA